jgi:hypothetical protein
MADGFAHALDLMLATLVQRQFEPRRSEPPDLRRRRAAVIELDAFGKSA